MSLRYRLFVFFTLLFLIFAVDQATKYWAFQNLLGQSPSVYLKGLFQFVYAENPGAFLGLGGQLSRPLRFIIFAVVVLGGLVAMVWYLIKKEKSKLNFYAYSLILAGGFGNLWDRVVHESGHVIDFMLIDLGGPLRTGVFNFADMAIVAGVLLALFGEYILDKRLSFKAKTVSSNKTN